MKRKLSPRPVQFTFLLLIIPLFLLVVGTAHMGSKLMRETMPLQDAGMMIKNELVSFHLSLERKAYMNPGADSDETLKHLDKAEWYAKAMLSGGKDSEWTFTPLDDPDLREETDRIIAGIKDLRALFKKGLLKGKDDSSEVGLERQIDPLVIAVAGQADNVEAALHDAIIKQQREYLHTVYILLAFCVLLAVAAGVVLQKYLSNIRKSRDEMSSMRSFLQSVIDGVTELIMVIDSDYNIILHNKASGEFFNLKKPVKCYEYSHGLEGPCEGAGWPCPLKLVLQSGSPVTMEHQHNGEDGTMRYVEISASPMKDSGGRITGIIESSRDITERKELERQRADFYAMVTHDLKSPLTSILGYTDLILSGQAGKFDAAIGEMIEGVNKSGGRLLKIVDDFLALSKMESGEKFQSSPCNIRALLVEAAKDFEVMASQRRVNFKIEVPEGLPVVSMERRSMQRAVANLLQNAVNYTPSGGNVTLRAGLRTMPGGESVEIAVADTGPGIPAGERSRIFERYYRSPRTSGIRGSGLGLAIVKAVAEAHGGSVELESEEGRGSTFRLMLPVKKLIVNQIPPQPPFDKGGPGGI